MTVPGNMHVADAHDCRERIEAAIEDRLPKTSVSTHLELDQSTSDRQAT
jgi:divalent metal cation (Fe/Co/Zn/Cd) transporter